MTVFAPFRFAPVHRWVYFPEWGPLVSHDVPFADGLSGWIELEIKAETPLLVGGARRKPADAREGEVWPFQLPDGRWAIPPSGLQGMVRSILEVATFARLGPWIDDRRFGIRDLTPPAEPYYQRRLNNIEGFGPIRVDPRVRTGWLRRLDDGRFQLKPCSFARIEFDDLARLTGIQQGPVPDQRHEKQAYEKARAWRKKSDADERYGWVKPDALRQSLQVEPAAPQPRHRHRAGTPQELSIAYRKVTGLRGPTAGRIVLTGNPSDPPHNPRASSKHLEFFFFDEAPEKPLEDFAARFDEFLAIHQPDDGRRENPNWKFFRDHGYPGELPFNRGGWMPIFYLPDDSGGIESFGLAFMFKLAHEKRTLDLLKNSSPHHVAESGDGRADLPSLIFGSVAGGPSNGLKRRAAFDVATAALPAGERLLDREPTVLLGPKPSYFPIYVRQPEGAPGRLPAISDRGRERTLAYATYTPIVRREQYPQFTQTTAEHREPELSGVKIWPVKDFVFPPLSDDVRRNRKVQTRLRALPAGTQFGPLKLRFHNLRPQELGALLWALTFGESGALQGQNSGKRHRLGMGKPYGLGQLSIRITSADVRPNDPEKARSEDHRQALADALGSFVGHMRSVYPSGPAAGTWDESVQVRSLLKAADPQGQRGERLDYMELGERRNEDSFVGARFNGWVLPRYAEGGEAPREEEASTAPRRAGGERGGPAPRRATPVPATPPRVGARVRLNAGGIEGSIVEEHANEPRWGVLLDGGKKPVRYRATVLTVIA